MKRLLVLFAVAIFFLLGAVRASAQTLPDDPHSSAETFVKGVVQSILTESTQTVDGFTTLTQQLQVRILEGTQQGKVVTIQRGSDVRLTQNQRLTPGTQVIVDIIARQGETPQYTITDIYRLDSLGYLAIFFFIFTILVAGKKGFGSLIGLLVSGGIILGFMIPQIVHGADALLISIISSMAILLITTYLAHGFSKQTSIAVLATFISLFLAFAFSQFAVNFAHLAGLGTEDSYLIELNPSLHIDVRGLLLGGILLGTLGALNDVTTTQVAAIMALFKQNTKMSFWVLAEQGFFIGREHIVSLVNTLVLAYAGSALPLFIFFILNPSHLPTWVIINNESLVEEFIRTIGGSFGIVLAVPVATFLASWFATRDVTNHA